MLCLRTRMLELRIRVLLVPDLVMALMHGRTLLLVRRTVIPLRS